VKLGLRPEAVAWVWSVKEEKHILLLLWSGVDKVGPLQVTRRLFKAYNASLLPKAIDPFVVELHSPNWGFGDLFMQVKRGSKPEAGVFRIKMNDEVVVGWRSEWVYRARAKANSTIDNNRDWKRFTESVPA
jgi:hypothetical protein